MKYRLFAPTSYQQEKVMMNFPGSCVHTLSGLPALCSEVNCAERTHVHKCRRYGSAAMRNNHVDSQCFPFPHKDIISPFPPRLFSSSWKKSNTIRESPPLFIFGARVAMPNIKNKSFASAAATRFSFAGASFVFLPMLLCTITWKICAL